MPSSKKDESHSEKSPCSGKEKLNPINAASAALIVILVAGYATLVMHNKVEELSTSTILLIALAILASLLLVYPSVIEKLGKKKIGDFEVETLKKVEQIERDQEEQAKDLSLVEDLLPLLLPISEQAHLVNLLNGTTTGYVGRGALRAELRRLRSAGLIEMTRRGHIESLMHGREFDLIDYVKLTDLGIRWAKHILQLRGKEGIKGSHLYDDEE